MTISLFATLSNRLLPFGEKRRLTLTFLDADGDERQVETGPWSAGGKGYSPARETLPPGIEFAAGACGGFLDGDGPRLGYLRITGSMDRQTLERFHEVFDALEGMDALLLDARGMGGGGDGPAWEMVGRLFSKSVANGRGRIEPSGSWQFDGPVVLLQDSLQVSSAETFTWAVSETGRVVSIGRPTGGWAIIPRGFSCPSGLVDFRLGVTDRGTPIGGVHTEGIGWPPDLEVPWGAVMLRDGDPTLELATQVARAHVVERDADAVRKGFRALFAGDGDRFVQAATRGDWIEESAVRGLAKRFSDDLRSRIELELRLLDNDVVSAPDYLASAHRMEALQGRAKAAGEERAIRRWQSALRKARKELEAQEAVLEAADAGLALDPDAEEALAKKHGKTAFWNAWKRILG